MKRIFPILAFALLLIILVFPVSATETETVSTETRTINIHMGSSRTVEFEIVSGWCWGDLIADETTYIGFYVVNRSYGTVWLTDQYGADLFRISNSAGEYVHISDVISDDDYYVDYKNFSITVGFPLESGVVTNHPLTASGGWTSRPLREFVLSCVRFGSGRGNCRFVYKVVDKVVVLRLEVNHDPSNVVDYLLVTEDPVTGEYEPVYSPDAILYNGSSFRAVLACEGGYHPYSDFVTVTEPTCTETGIAKRQCFLCSVEESTVLPVRKFHDYTAWTTVADPTCTDGGSELRSCKLCGHEDVKTLDPLGHDFPVVGACRREGCDEYTGKNLVDGAGNLWNGVTGWVGGLFDGESSEGESSDDDDNLDKILKFLTREPTGDPFLDGVDAIIKLFAIALPVLVFFFLWPILKPVVEFFGDVFRAGFKATSSGVKSFAKWVKSKKKRKKKK